MEIRPSLDASHPTVKPLQIMLVTGEQALAILPTRFRKLIWVKRGDYLITSTSAGEFETSAGEAGKVSHVPVVAAAAAAAAVVANSSGSSSSPLFVTRWTNFGRARLQLLQCY